MVGSAGTSFCGVDKRSTGRLNQSAAGLCSAQQRAIAGGLIAFLIMVCQLLLICGNVKAYAASETIAGYGQGAGEVDLPVGTAVHQASGDVYVADRNNFRIGKFDSEGNFLLGWGLGVADGVTPTLQTCGPQAVPPQDFCFSPNFSWSSDAGSIIPVAIAVDQNTGDVYVADAIYDRITKFTSSGEFIFLVGANVNATKVAEAGATQAEKNICTAASGDSCTGGTYGTGPNEFAAPRSLAVSPSGVVWVGDVDRLVSFDPSGTPGMEIPLPGAGDTQSLAMNSTGEFYIKSAFLTGIRKLAGPSASVPGEPLEVLDVAGDPRTVALDADDNVYVGDANNPYRFMKFNSSGEQVAQFGAGEVLGTPGSPSEGANALSIGESADALYVASSESGSNSFVQLFSLPEPGPLVEGEDVEDVLPTTATLTARINPESDETTYRFEYGTDKGYGQSTPLETLLASGFEAEDVEAQLEGLSPYATYHFRVVAISHCNPAEPTEVCTAEGEDQTFTTLPAVVIDPQWATNNSADSAALHAELNPLGVEAEAWIEYGTGDSYGQIILLPNLGDGFGPVTRQASLEGLRSSTTYHYRFVARDQRDGVTYTVYGSDHTFTTQFGGLGFALADNRTWELVSPPDKNGARLVGGGEIHLQASVDGNGLAYQSKLSTETDPEGNRIPEASMNLARRFEDGSWHSQDITPPNEEVTGTAGGNGTEYKLFSPDLSEALLEPRSHTALSEKASERTPYLRENEDPPVYTPLVTAKEPFANVPPGIEFGGEKAVPDVAVVGADPNFRYFALKSEVPLIEGAATSGPTLYEWADGQVKSVSVLPAYEGGALIGNVNIGSGPGSTRGGVSEDGSRVFWSDENGGAIKALYVSDTEAEMSARLDVKQPSASGIGSARPIFQAASADGTVVYFTDSQRLTADASHSGSDLYRCRLPTGSIASGCATLTDISMPTAAGESGEVQGIAPAATADGAAIYFVARGVLDDAPNQFGDSAVSGESNLYHWQEGEGSRFIATLSDVDRSDWGRESETEFGFAVQLSAAASPGGRYLAFMSQRNLTGYDNRDVSGGEPAQELFRYDALTDQLECVSCNPTGGRPHGSVAPGGDSLLNPLALWQGMRMAAILPQATDSATTTSGISFYRPRAVLDNGRVFFNAIDSLVPGDSNGQWDVYQHEPIGVGDCTAASSASSISRLEGGCVSLISSGTAEEEAAFFDASGTGDDAFFWSPARLSALDEDDEVDIYDARVNGVLATREQSSECLGESCQSPSVSPSSATPASVAFQGSGNLQPAARRRCPKGKRRVRRHGRVHCVAKKRRKASASRGVGR